MNPSPNPYEDAEKEILMIEDSNVSKAQASSGNPVVDERAVSLALPQEVAAFSVREGQAVSLLYLVYRHFHEGHGNPGETPLLPNVESDPEVLDLIHSWLANNNLDPYTNGGPEAIEVAASHGMVSGRSFWDDLFLQIADLPRQLRRESP